MEEGVNKHWTHEKEETFTRLLGISRSFAQRELLMSLRDMLKYDLRTRAGKRAVAKARLRIASASDTDLEEMATLEVGLRIRSKFVPASERANPSDLVAERLEALKQLRAEIMEKGIKRSDLECQ